MQNNISYDEYIRSILGYPPINSNNNITYSKYTNQDINYENRVDSELEKCYPEIYKIVYPMITTKCSNLIGNITKDDIENMTDEIYYALEEKNEVKLNINLTNNIKTSDLNSASSKMAEKKPEVKVNKGTGENRETRQINRGLRDLIKILLIRELLNRPGRPNRPPYPPMPGPGPRPPVRPPMRPPYGPPRPNSFNREFESFDYDIFEY